MMILRQGNTYRLPFRLRRNGVVIKDTDVEWVEFCFEDIVTKNYPENISFDTDHFVIELSQEETFALEATVRYQIRVKYTDGTVKSTPTKYATVYESLSKEVL